jgi:uncharacterized membrane protein YhaH (DUF805 family)
LSSFLSIENLNPLSDFIKNNLQKINIIILLFCLIQLIFKKIFMKKFIKDLFTWRGRWNRLKFWIYPLVSFVLILPIIWAISFTSLSWYTQGAKQAYLVSKEKSLETYISIQKTNWTKIEDINNDPKVIKLKNNIEQTKNDLKESTDHFSLNNILQMLLRIFWLIAYLAVVWISIAAYIKRLHDLDRSGWLILIAIIPLVNIWLLIYCGFFKWTPWKNKFWDNPLGNIGWDITQNWTPNKL